MLTRDRAESALDGPGFSELMAIRGRGRPAAGDVTLAGADPIYPTRFRIGETCAMVLASIGIAVSDIWELKTGRRQQVGIDVRHAAASLRMTDFTAIRDAQGVFQRPIEDPVLQRTRSRMTQPRPTADDRWFLPHFNLPHLKRRVLDVLGCEDTPEAVTAAVSRWRAGDLEEAIAQARACGSIVRSHAEWIDHPQGRLLAGRPVVEIEKIAGSEVEPFAAQGRPLSDIRVLDLTRILAGPVAGRTLAEHGADVLMVTAPHLPQVAEHVRDTSHGKRSCFLDIEKPDDARRLLQLVEGADVFSQGYRPGSLAAKGFGPEQLAALRPGLIYLSVSCYGDGGPLSDRAGWEQIGQAASGICHENGGEKPALIPVAACDYTTGYLGAYGVLLALARRAREGGSYHVKVSLCQAGMFIFRQGRTAFDAGLRGLGLDDVRDILVESSSPYGRLRHLGPVLRLSETPPDWWRPTPRLGADPAAW